MAGRHGLSGTGEVSPACRTAGPVERGMPAAATTTAPLSHAYATAASSSGEGSTSRLRLMMEAPLFVARRMPSATHFDSQKPRSSATFTLRSLLLGAMAAIVPATCVPWPSTSPIPEACTSDTLSSIRAARPVPSVSMPGVEHGDEDGVWRMRDVPCFRHLHQGCAPAAAYYLTVGIGDRKCVVRRTRRDRGADLTGRQRRSASGPVEHRRHEESLCDWRGSRHGCLPGGMEGGKDTRCPDHDGETPACLAVDQMLRSAMPAGSRIRFACASRAANCPIRNTLAAT